MRSFKEDLNTQITFVTCTRVMTSNFRHCTFLSVEAVPDYSKLTLTQAKRFEMESQVLEFFELRKSLGEFVNLGCGGGG